MNRKGTREQNDISIIRNLPRRLQQKIVDEVGDDYSLVDNIEGHSHSGATSSGANKHADNKGKTRGQGTRDAMAEGTGDKPRIDLFLQMANNAKVSHVSRAETVLETSGEAVATQTATSPSTSPSSYGCLKSATPVIPGILRVSVADTHIPTSCEKSAGATARENGKRCARQQLMREEQQQKLPSSPVRQQIQQVIQPTWFESLAEMPYTKQLPQAYTTITKLLQRQAVFENWADFAQARCQLKVIFEKLLLHHLKLCCEQKVDTFFWKLLFYNVREYLKNHKSSTESPIHLLTLLDEGLEYYTDLHSKLSSKYLVTSAATTLPPLTQQQQQRVVHKFEFIAKVAAQKLLICLGDLSRYKAKELQSNDYAEATKYYQQAQSLIPTNGIPYNQLAIVAIHARKKFDAIYFHMRSLVSSNAIYSARESLLVLFDEIRKKYEETELKTSSANNSPKPNHSNHSKSMRTEIWIHPDGARCLHRTNGNSNDKSNSKMTMNEEKRFDEMSTEDLLRCFTSLYLYVIGKLYTGVGMESILEHQRKLFVQLSVLLKRSALPLTRSRMLKMVALNIFTIEHNRLQESRRYYAFNFCNQLLGLLLRKCNKILDTYAENAINYQEQRFTDLNTLLQFIKIYLDWLAQNVLLWEPVRNADHIFIDCWPEWQCLHLHLQRIVTADANTQLASIYLEEDQFLLGFTPLAKCEATTAAAAKCHTPHCSNDNAQFPTRIAKICEFWHCYEENKMRLIASEESHFTLEELNSAIKSALDSLQSDEDDNNENIVVNGENTEKPTAEAKLTKVTNVEDAQISQLSKRKKELEAKTNEKKMYNAKLEEILKFVDTKLYIEVRPKYLLPDTNCFIDCLEDFKQLIKEFRRYTLIIPLTVVKELDGLSKGVKLESYEKSLQKHRIHHFDDVTTCAKRSLDFINKNSIKCATTKGSIINASLFALVEEENVSNDDKILATALALSKTMSKKTCKDDKCFIQTELVLITTDRNLRVKALSRNLAVSELGEFLQWAKDCNT